VTSMEDMLIDPEEMRDAARRLLADKVDRRAPWDGKAGSTDALEADVGELGWYQLTAPAAQGGLGQRFDVLAPIYEELGRSLAPLWLSGTMAAIDALNAVGGDDADQIVAAVVEQGWRITPVFLADGQSLESASLPMVPGACEATHLLIVDAAGGASLLACTASGVTVKPVETWDLGRSYGEVTLARVVDVLCRFDSASLLPILRAHLELALAWDSVGAASQSMTETVEYMLGRQQFGRPIASFQALKHRAADHKVAIELARSLVTQASSVFAVRGEGWAVLATQARILACEAFAGMAEDSIQLFGGVGFTWEYNPHLFLKRALVNQIIGGSPDDLRDRVAGDVCARAMASRH
jgi:alkylation response protein AidB-like acyl-CoA dehydrogenase